MEFWPEFLASSGGHEFMAGGVGGMAGVLAGHPLDTLRVRLQQPPSPVSPGITAPRPSAVTLLRGILRVEGPSGLYRGMGAPLASVAFQNAMVFQVYAILSRSLDPQMPTSEPPSYTSVAALAGVGTGALQTLILSPVELVKIRLQLEAAGQKHHGPVDMARDIMRREGLRGIYRGLSPGRAGARRLLLDVRVRAGAAAPGLPAHGAREPRHDARVRRPRGSRQLRLLLPAGRGEVASAGIDTIVAEVPRRCRLLPEERMGGGASCAVARPRHGCGASVRRQRRYLLGLRAGPAVLGALVMEETNCQDHRFNSIHLQQWHVRGVVHRLVVSMGWDWESVVGIIP